MGEGDESVVYGHIQPSFVFWADWPIPLLHPISCVVISGHPGTQPKLEGRRQGRYLFLPAHCSRSPTVLTREVSSPLAPRTTALLTPRKCHTVFKGG